MDSNRGRQDSSFEQARRVYDAWAEQWLWPAIDAIYTADFSAAKAVLDRARTELDRDELPADVAEALGIYHRFLYYRWHWDPAVGGYSADSYREAVSWLSQPADSYFGESMRLSVLLPVRANGTLDGYDSLSSEETKAILDRLPDAFRPRAINHVAKLAFARHDLALIELALAELTVNPSRTLGQATWQRLNMMYQLLSGKATRRDVEETIRTLEIRPQLCEFKDRIWPECVKAGLTDAELEELLAEKEADIMARDTGPRPERRTKSYIGRF